MRLTLRTLAKLDMDMDRFSSTSTPFISQPLTLLDWDWSETVAWFWLALRLNVWRKTRKMNVPDFPSVIMGDLYSSTSFRSIYAIFPTNVGHCAVCHR